MIARLIAYFLGDGAASARKRLKNSALHSIKVCEYCHATATLEMQVCGNCLTRFARGLSREKWVSEAIQNQVNYLEQVDSIKYGASAKITAVVRKGAQTLQKLSLSSKFRTA